MTFLYILIAILAIVFLWAIAAFNHFITLANHAREAWSDIDVQLKRRYDLIPNLVNTVKGYATHESAAFENVSKARAAAMGATGAAKGDAENQLTGALKSLFAVSEAYPELKANQNFLELQRELSDTEDKIQAARRFYNSTVMTLNTALQTFPNSLVAGLAGASPMELFELGSTDAAATQPVSVQF